MRLHLLDTARIIRLKKIHEIQGNLRKLNYKQLTLES